MPRIPPIYIDAVVYLYSSVKAAERNEPQGGCGVLVGIESEEFPDLRHVYVATNVHVAQDSRVVRCNTDQGPKAIDLSSAPWIAHPDGSDVAVCSLGIHAFFDARASVIPITTFVTRDIVKDIPLRHGDEVFMISRYIGHPGDGDIEPVVRFGTLAKSRPVTIDGKEGFLAEMRSLPGHSGSPTFAFYYGMQARLGADTEDKLPKPAIYLLGLDWGHPPERRPVMEPGRGPVPNGLYVNDNSGMACVAPAWKVVEVLELEKFIIERREFEIIYGEVTNAPTIDPTAHH